MLLGFFNYLTYLFKKERQFYFKLISLLGFLPSHISLYKIALTHKSASSVMKDGSRVNNERLEYLGDALLGAIAAEYIYKEFDHGDEGFMTKVRARIVKRKHLNATAINMGIPGIINSHPHPATVSKHLYGNALEALIGAIYLDKGYKFTARFFKKMIINKYVDLEALAKKDSDYKSQLIEWTQKNKKKIEFISKEEEASKGRSPTFVSVVMIDMMEAGWGKGDSKKEAEQQAAKIALKEISE